MAPKIAALICIVFILFLFWADRKRDEHFSDGLWIPFLWMFFGAGRYFEEWLHLSAAGLASVRAYHEGNPVNAAAFSVLIAAGVYVLSARDVDWGRFLSKNKLIWLYIAFCLISVLWADDPFVSFKRWTKEFGNLVMVLVILTEERPYESLGALLRRLAYLWLPLSVLFVRYYPALGRSFTEQGGQTFTGIGMQKNQLGALCLVSLIYYGWHFIVRRKADFKFWSINNLLDMVLLLMALWLLRMSHSATSLACAAVATATFAASRFVSRKPGRIIAWSAAVIVIYLGLNAAFDLNHIVIHALGRKQNLTGREEVWAIVDKMVVNPWVGAGYESFWSGQRLSTLWVETGSKLLQAHNGYLEQYLELGYIGLAFILAIMLSGIVKIRRLLYLDYAAGILLFSFIEVAVLYNCTEASFYAINNIWLLTVLAVTLSPGQSLAKDRQSLTIAPAKGQYNGFNESTGL